MKSLYTKGILGLGLMTLALTSFSEAKAENELTISPNPLIISTYESMPVSIELTNDDPVVALNFDLSLPKGLVLDGTFTSSETRVPQTTVLDYSELGANTYRIALVSFSDKAIKENEGSIITFNVKAEDGVLDDFSEGSMTLSAIQLTGSGSGKPGEIAPSYESNTSYRADVKFLQGTFEMTAQEEEYSYVPGEWFTMSLGMTNSIAVQGIGFKIQVPEGFVINDDSFNRVRLNSAAMISTKFDEELGICVVEILTINGQPVIAEEGEGTFLTFEVMAPEGYDELESEVKFYECNVSVGSKNVSLDVNDVTSKLINEEVANEQERKAYNEEALQNDQDILVALNEKFMLEWSIILDERPEYAESEQGMATYEEIWNALLNMSEACDAAFDEAEADGWYVSPIPDNFEDEINDMIEQMVNDSNDHERKTYNEEALHQDQEILLALNEKFMLEWSIILEERPEYAASEKGMATFEEIWNALLNMSEACDAAYEEAEADGWYVSPIPDNFEVEINDMIEQMVKDSTETGVASVSAESAAEYYSIDGKKLDRAAQGINIVRRGDKVSKVIVK